ncbi:hypothetical protein JZ751_006959 [Albula glossodonta]|uniref:Uncharacterized protein n=1 Tax=Albula glossodonta TaxID=121402 RepID=A0A8T2PAW0_9TELE|nr:hypothetical protein JZ751_006959 [Albula glossodonta]
MDAAKNNPGLNTQTVQSQALPAFPLLSSATYNQTTPPLCPAIPQAWAEDAVFQKLQWATQKHQDSSLLETSIKHCTLIHSCADCVRRLKELQCRYRLSGNNIRTASSQAQPDNNLSRSPAVHVFLC